MQSILQFLQKNSELPVIEKNEKTLGKLFATYARAEFTMHYPLTQKDEPILGYVIGYNPQSAVLYVSQHAILDENEEAFARLRDPALALAYIKNIEEL